MNESNIKTLGDLSQLRSAPNLTEDQRSGLREELNLAMKAYAWFTVGVMAPSGERALQSLRQLETACGWDPMTEEGPVDVGEGVFLKANQSSGTIRIRQESGLGSGVLISGHQPDGQEPGPTWGPLPLDLFQG